MEVTCEKLDYNKLIFTAADESEQFCGNMTVRVEPAINVIENIDIAHGMDDRDVVNALLDELMFAGDIEKEAMAVPAFMLFSEESLDGTALQILGDRNDCVISPEGTGYMAFCSDFLKNPVVEHFLAKEGKADAAVPLSKLTDLQLKEIFRALDEKEINPTETLDELKKEYLEGTSLALVNDDVVEGCMLMSEEEPGTVTLDAVYAKKEGPAVMEMFIQAAQEAVARNPQMLFSTLAVNERVQTLLDKLLEHAKDKYVSRVYQAHFLPGMDNRAVFNEDGEEISGLLGDFDEYEDDEVSPD